MPSVAILYAGDAEARARAAAGEPRFPAVLAEFRRRGVATAAVVYRDDFADAVLVWVDPIHAALPHLAEATLRRLPRR